MSLHIMQPFVDKEGQNVLKLQKHSFSRGFGLALSFPECICNEKGQQTFQINKSMNFFPAASFT